MECLHEADHKCEHRRNTNTCVRPNPWIAFLRYYGKQGFTRIQIRNEYRRLKHVYAATWRQRTCLHVRKTGNNHRRTIPNVANLCHDLGQYIRPLPGNEAYAALWKRVIYSAHTYAKYGKWPLNWGIHDNVITIQRLRRLITLIDEVFFHSSFRTRLAHVGHTLNIELVPDLSPVLEPWSMMIRYPVPNHELLRINLDKVNGTVLPVAHDGVLCTTRLQWVAHTVAHELMHVIIAAFCGEQYKGNGGHGYYFRTLNKRVYGHSDNIYEYEADYQVDVID